MKDIKEQVTTLEQSKRLKKLGFTKDTASLQWKNFSRIGKIDDRLWAIGFAGGMHPADSSITLPCWTIADMMKILADAIGFDLDVLGRIGIYSADEPCEVVVGKKITVRDDYSLLRDNFFEALVTLKEDKYL